MNNSMYTTIPPELEDDYCEEFWETLIDFQDFSNDETGIYGMSDDELSYLEEMLAL